MIINCQAISLHPHQLRKLIKTDPAISIQISRLQQLTNILLTHVLPQLLQSQPQFLHSYQSIPILIEHFEHSQQISRLILALHSLAKSLYIYFAMKLRNSSNSMVPLLSWSMFLMMVLMSSSVVLYPNCFIMLRSS